MIADETADRKPSLGRPLYAEELVVGSTYRFGEYAMTADEIATFGAKWDPLPLHLSEGDADGSAFGRLVASGVHTIAVFQRLCVLAVFSDWDIFAGRRLEDVRMLAPVFPGDVLTGGLELQSVVLNHPGRALVTCFAWLENDRGRVMQLTSESYVNRRP